MKQSGTSSVRKFLVGILFWIFKIFNRENSIVVIVSIFNDLWGIFTTFYVWNNFKLDMLQGDGYFCDVSVDILWGKCETLFSMKCNKCWQWNTFVFGVSLGFSANLFEAIDCEDWWRGEYA